MRAISDVRRLRSRVADPFDRSELMEYLCTLAKEMGFNPVKNLRHETVKIDCGWRDGQELFLAANVDFGSEREVLGAAAEIIISRPEIGLLITASNSLKPTSNVASAVQKLEPDFEVVVVDINADKTATIRGKRC